MTSNLALCPFCGEEPYFSQPVIGSSWWDVSCGNVACGIVGPPKRGKAEAREAWNHRSGNMGRLGDSLQRRVRPWMMACFGPEIASDKLERGDRLLEEVFELLQAADYPRERIRALEEYVDSRPKGEINQEVGGVMITLAAHCLAHGVDMHEAGEIELARIWTKVDAIRAKQAAKPTGSALPVALVPTPALEATEECQTCNGTGKEARHQLCRDCDEPIALEANQGYADAFYELASLLDIPAQALSPSEVWRGQMLPKLAALEAVKATGPTPSSNPMGRWLPIEHADKSVDRVYNFLGMPRPIANSEEYWCRDADGRVYLATWADDGESAYWWDLEGESPVDPVEYMPHPLAPETEGSTDGQ